MRRSKLPKRGIRRSKRQRDGTKNNDVALGASLSEFILQSLRYPNVWGATPVNIEPEKWIDSWGIVKIVKAAANHDHYGYHFVGRNMKDGNGAVSSKIETFDPHSMTGITHSGRVYQLVGLPGSNYDAEYVLSYWLQVNQVEAKDATAEFIEQYGISLDHIGRLTK